MSVPLPVIDMSQYATGQSSYVTLDAAKQAQPSPITQATEKCHIRCFNDSGSHLRVWMDTGDLNEYLPAGGWLTWEIDQTANEFHWTVINILPNPPVQLMMITWYKQGEPVPEVPTLGNSPIGGGVSATTPGVGDATSLHNLTSVASSTPIVEIKSSAASADNFSVDNQGNILDQQYVGTTLTQLFRVLAGVAANGINVQLSDANHQTEIMGTMRLDGRVYAPPAGNFQFQLPAAAADFLIWDAVSGAALDLFGPGASGGGSLNLWVPVQIMKTGQGLISGSGVNLVISTQAVTDVINMQSNGVNVLQVLNNAVQISQAIKSPSGKNLTLDTNAATDSVTLSNNGFTMLQILQNEIRAWASIMSSSGTNLVLNTHTATDAVDIDVNGNLIMAFLSNAINPYQSVVSNAGAVAGFKAAAANTPGVDVSACATGQGVKFPTGSISRIAAGFVGTGTGGTAVTHNFGVVPQFFFGNATANGTVWFGGYNTTQVTVYCSVTANVWWCCLSL